MNILLDVGDRVKIGDFGLATRDLLLKKESVAGPNGLAPNGDHSTTGNLFEITFLRNPLKKLCWS